MTRAFNAYQKAYSIAPNDLTLPHSVLQVEANRLVAARDQGPQADAVRR